ncbi:hypothetical protein TNIN_350441 [Trichonephila inaurata madagascariensis]|uniref:Uncharacterized protein n=1 Tax=Trichonephila inaurata madagascariensis TaxID=2747483 RepID=A0A8X7CQW1_9ARAC|nr:hypothetical protein TNIN_350441 [Trichonephila inaurata madagascariensis]
MSIKRSLPHVLRMTAQPNRLSPPFLINTSASINEPYSQLSTLTKKATREQFHLPLCSERPCVIPSPNPRNNNDPQEESQKRIWLYSGKDTHRRTRMNIVCKSIECALRKRMLQVFA